MRWEEEKEKGSRLGMVTLLWLARLLGYWPGAVITLAVAFFHWSFSPRARRASAGYLRRVGEIPPGAGFLVTARATLRHFSAFAINLYDRVWLWQGRTDLFEIERDGHELMLGLKGAVLVGAHVGSFDLMRVLSHAHSVKVHAVMYTQAGAKFAGLLRSINPDAGVDVFLLDGRLEQVFEMQALVKDGGILAVMADRQTPGAGKLRSIDVPFLGEPAPFPAQVWHLASLLECPVVLVSAVRTGWRRYRVTAQTFSERIEVPRKEREAALRGVIERFAQSLEETCRQAPYQWFNYFDFWKGSRNTP